MKQQGCTFPSLSASAAARILQLLGSPGWRCADCPFICCCPTAGPREVVGRGVSRAMDAPRNQDRIALKGISRSIRLQSLWGVWDVECGWVWASPLKVTTLHVCFRGEELHRSCFLRWVLECSREAAHSSRLSGLMNLDWITDIDSTALPLTDLVASAFIDMALHRYPGDQNSFFFFSHPSSMLWKRCTFSFLLKPQKVTAGAWRLMKTCQFEPSWWTVSYKKYQLKTDFFLWEHKRQPSAPRFCTCSVHRKVFCSSSAFQHAFSWGKEITASSISWFQRISESPNRGCYLNNTGLIL